jgi:hypothetical protein
MKKLAFSTQNTATLCKKNFIKLFFKKSAIFSSKMGKIDENCAQNIDPGGQYFK